MSNTLGNILKVTLFGESHGRYIGATLDNMVPGIFVDEEEIKKALSLRRPSFKGETNRVEEDRFEIISGVFNSYTTGAPLTILIENSNVRSSSYEEIKDLARPSHADYVANEKYLGYQDYRGGGHFSGRLTAPLVALAPIVNKALEKYGIKIGSHIVKCGDFEERRFVDVNKDISSLIGKKIPLLEGREEDFLKVIEEVSKVGDSIGGKIEVGIINLEVGLGEPWFDSLEGKIANSMFAIGGVKGIEFGRGFEFASLKGSEANDSFRNEEGKIVTSTNNNGGINGGISNGMPVVFSLAIKPTPSISLKQETVNVKSKENSEIEIKGRHDPCIVRRICPVVNAVTSFVILDELLLLHGTKEF